MSQIVTLKAQAANLVESLAARGIKLTRAQGLELIAEQYGMKNWDTLSGMLKPKDSAASAPCSADLPAIPHTVKSVKGVKVLQLTSADGDFYDEFFLLPPHLDIEVIKCKVDEELVRLKQRDRDNEEDEAYQPYMDTDVIAFVTSLGLEHVEPEKARENWDY